MATENRTWGYERIRGTPSNLGHEVANSTIGDILKRNGIEPLPERVRKTTGRSFSRPSTGTTPWRSGPEKGSGATWCCSSSTGYPAARDCRDLRDRKAILDEPDPRNLTEALDGLLKGKRYLIHDRDPLFTTDFLSTLATAGTKSVKLPPRSPNLNSYAERFVRSIKEGCLDRMILFGEDALLLIVPDPLLANRDGPIRCQSHLGGMLKYYDRAA